MLVWTVAIGCTPEIAGTPGLVDVGTTDVDPSTTSSSSSTEALTESASATEAESSSTTEGEAEESSSTSDGGALCGDGLVTGLEDCDCGGKPCTPEALRNNTCTSIGNPMLTGGTLGCNPASCRFDTSGCSVCGDHVIEGTEICDGPLEDPPTCEALGKGTLGQVVCGSDCNYDTSDCTPCGYAFDFEACNGGWTVGKTDPLAANPSWECGDPPNDGPPYGPPANTAGVWATRLDGYYSANESSYLLSPPLDLSVCKDKQLTLSLRHWHNFEALADGGIVQVRGNAGGWVTLTPSDGPGYGDDPIVASFPPVAGSRGFDGTTGDAGNALATTEFDMTAYAGQTGVEVRFVFGSNGSSVAPGWYIDSVTLEGD